MRHFTSEPISTHPCIATQQLRNPGLQDKVTCVCVCDTQASQDLYPPLSRVSSCPSAVVGSHSPALPSGSQPLGRARPCHTSKILHMLSPRPIMFFSSLCMLDNTHPSYKIQFYVSFMKPALTWLSRADTGRALQLLGLKEWHSMIWSTPREPLAESGDMFGCHTSEWGGEGCYLHLVSRGQGCCEHPTMSRTAPKKNYPAKMSTVIGEMTAAREGAIQMKKVDNSKDV